MALRKNPYLPLYVNDFLCDENLALCSAESTGVYIRLLCLMHKSDQYGKILLKQKTSKDDLVNFSTLLTKQMPYEFQVVKRSLVELLSYNIIAMENETLIQKRMVKDFEISEKRAISGSKGGNKTQSNFAQANAKAKIEANTDIDNDNEIKGKGGLGEREFDDSPPYEQVLMYFRKSGGTEEMAERFYNKYRATNWSMNGSRIKNFASLANNFIMNWKGNHGTAKPKTKMREI